MPPKKKGGKKKESRPASAATTGDGSTGPTVESLSAQLGQVAAEKEQEQRERNYYQLERDKVTGFWEITKKELEELRSQLRNKERQLEEQEEQHQIEMKVYKQKVRHMLYEHKVTMDRVKTESEVSAKVAADEHADRESELKGEKRTLRMENKESELAHEETIRKLKQDNDKNITKLRQEFEREVREIQMKYERKMRLLREDLELRRRAEVHEIEERKNEHIQELMSKHAKAFAEIKAYYNDITTNNLDLIRSLKEEVEVMKKKEAKNEKLMFEIAQENKRLSEPLTNALNQVEQLRAELANYQKDKMSLKNSKARLKLLEGQLKALSWEHEVLQQRFGKVASERDDLYNKFEKALLDVQQRAGFRNLLLERKLESVSEQLEKKEAQLAEVLRAANLDPSVLGSVTAKLEEILDGKNRMIRDMQYELAKVAKAHNDMIGVMENKMREFGIPSEELGFTPVSPAADLGIDLPKAGAGPAGLLASS
jgi:chromosome segregation ATPase